MVTPTSLSQLQWQYSFPKITY